MRPPDAALSKWESGLMRAAMTLVAFRNSLLAANCSYASRERIYLRVSLM